MTLYHIGISGGKDSTALLLWAIHKSGLPREALRCTFCDTGNEDPLTYAHIQLIEEKIIWPAGIVGGLETLIPPLQFFALAFKKGRFPSRKAQFCTTELKIEPTKRWLRARWDEGHETVILNGKRLDESRERKKKMKDVPERAFSDYWGCEELAALRTWTLNDVLAIHQEFGIPLNPLYAFGVSRIGCFPCVNCDKVEIRTCAEKRPEKIDEIAREEVRHETEGGAFSSFFAAKTATKPFRTKTVPGTDGKVFQVAPIREVVQWANTTRGGKQFRLPLADPPKVCFSKYHACE